MCSVCGSATGHFYNCPVADEPEPVGVCAWCEEPIDDDIFYVDLDGEKYHVNCVKDNAVDILETMFSFERKYA